MDFIYKRSEFRRPVIQLEHSDIYLSFYEDRVEGAAVMTFTARESVNEVVLDAKDLEIVLAEAIPCGGEFVYDKSERKLTIPLKHAANAGDKIVVRTKVISHPDDVHLEGIYKDVSPEGCPQQFMSQCQQFGFQRILPVVDDCTAKGTFRTLLEGDERYTHLISNGDCLKADASEPEYAGILETLGVSAEIPSGRKRVLYRNTRAMAPYLFIACVGTWDVLRDEVVYPDTGQKIKLEYLVPPGRTDGARVPMDILKKSILFQHDETGYSYPYDVYRTICMEKSLYGGMENTGNTTIITEAALIDETIGDRRLLYAYGVIAHEYEHNHCGSGVTMESVFDMWLNEGYTVNVERAFLYKTFGKAFMRYREIEEMREIGGPFAQEEAGTAGLIVREGVNDPDEVVDAVTYTKAPEVLNTLENLIGKENYRAGIDLYFKRYNNGNANTDQFLNCFSEVMGRDIAALMYPWLFTRGFPTVTASYSWREAKLTINLKQDKKFPVPVSFVVLTNGEEILNADIILDDMEYSATFDCPVKPCFISWNRGCRFYGMMNIDGVSDDELVMQVKYDADELNRIEAFRTLLDRARFSDGAREKFFDLYCEIFHSSLRVDDGMKARLLSIPREPTDRKMIFNVTGNVKAMHSLRRLAAEKIGEDELLAELAACEQRSSDGTVAEQILHREYVNVILQLLTELDTPKVHDALRSHLKKSVNITDRLNTLRSLLATSAEDCFVLLDEAGEALRKSLNGYIGWLGVLASNPNESVFALIEREENREGWSIKHPGLSRALYCGFAGNYEQLFTDKGLLWIEETLIKYAKVSEYNALRILEPLENYRSFPDDLKTKCEVLLRNVSDALPRNQYQFIGGRLASLL